MPTFCFCTCTVLSNIVITLYEGLNIQIYQTSDDRL